MFPCCKGLSIIFGLSLTSYIHCERIIEKQRLSVNDFLHPGLSFAGSAVSPYFYPGRISYLFALRYQYAVLTDKLRNDSVLTPYFRQARRNEILGQYS